MTYRYQGRSGLFLPSSVGHNGRSKMVKFGILEIWAEEGLVNYVVNDPDSDENGKCGHFTPDKALVRLGKVKQAMGKRGDLGMAKDNKDLSDFEKAWDGVLEVVQRAREQAPVSRPLQKRGAPDLIWRGKRPDGTGATLVERTP